jgi:Circularly permutated YpsA SLOG family
MKMIKKIISGGQSGVEIAALDTAIKLNIPHEGWAFQRKMKKGGFWPGRYNLKTVDKPSYHDRLKKNIIDSDGTVILTCGQLVLGSKIINQLAVKNNKPCLYLDLTKCSVTHAISSIRKWITNNEIETIYFTGSKPVDDFNIYEETIRIIDGVCNVEREQEMLPGFQQKDDDRLP